MVFINDRYPRATTASGSLQTDSDWVCQRTVVRRGASIGSGAMILGDLTIGERAIVGAGSVVTRDVSPELNRGCATSAEMGLRGAVR